jgi:hypothetical protein
MPLGTVLGEAISKITSVRIIDVGSGQQRTEIDAIGEIKGEVPGQGFSTAVFEGVPGHPATWAGTGRILTTSGAVVRTSSRGIAVRTGEGHKIRCRGAFSLATEDPKLAAFNNLIGAIEFEVDPVAMTLTGIACEWK